MAIHRTNEELEAGITEVLASPPDVGTLEAIVVRPVVNQRRNLDTAQLTVEGGIEGDRWVTESFYKLDDGRSDPRCQISLMNARFLRFIAGRDEAMCLAGDNLIVDFDLSEKNLPAGTRVSVGEVVLEISDLPHTGCSKFSERYGEPARNFANNGYDVTLHLRGRYAAVLSAGTIRIGDEVRKQSPT